MEHINGKSVIIMGAGSEVSGVYDNSYVYLEGGILGLTYGSG